MELTKDVFLQYTHILNEIAKLKEEQKKTEDAIVKLVEEGCVKDKVYGGDGGIQGFVVEGFPIAEYERRRKLLRSRKQRLIQKENELLELQETIEREIDKINNSRDRMIFLLYFVDGRTQNEVAEEIHVERSLVSKIINSYF